MFAYGDETQARRSVGMLSTWHSDDWTFYGFADGSMVYANRHILRVATPEEVTQFKD